MYFTTVLRVLVILAWVRFSQLIDIFQGVHRGRAGVRFISTWLLWDRRVFTGGGLTDDSPTYVVLMCCECERKRVCKEVRYRYGDDNEGGPP